MLAFGYVRPYKGIADVLAALVCVLEAELRVVGRFWEPVARYERLVERLGLAGRVMNTKIHSGRSYNDNIRSLFDI